MNRRTFLKGTVASGMLGVAASAGLLTPRKVLAAWPETAFAAKGIDEAVDSLFGSGTLMESSDIKIKAPEIAENGAVVPITISTGMAAESISVFIAENPSPLACSFALGGSTLGFISTRVKMGKTSDLVTVVKSGGKLYSTKKTIKVTIGGCGG